MSTSIPTSAGAGAPRALLLRQPAEDRLPAEARRRGGPPGRALRQAFVIDGPSLRPSTTTPVVVLAVNVVPESGGLADRSRAEAAPAVRAFVPRMIGDPYAEAHAEDRGTLVDAYV